MGRTGQHPALILGTAALLVAAVGTGVVLTRGSVPIAKAATTLADVRDAQVIAPDGHTVPGRDGQRVANGDVVRTGRTGSAELVTRGRVVYVDHSAAVAVIDGAHQQLRAGGAVIDAQHGPGLLVDLVGDSLAVPTGSATEATRSVSVHVGSLAGSSQITSATARRLTIPPLAQSVVNGDALPASTTPLHLSDDAAEAKAVPTLVNDDVALQDLARGIDSSGRAAAHVIDTSWTGTESAMPTAAPRSERVLPMVIADATPAAGGSTQDRYDHVVDWRRAGGSWGVVVQLLSAHASAVQAKFAALLRNQPTGQIGTVSFQSLAAPARGTTHSPTTSSAPPSTSTSPPTTGTSPGGGHHGGTPLPTPSPKPVRKVVTTGQRVVGPVLGLLPVKLLPKPEPNPTSSGGLLGGLLGK
jgi:hypothetical protein